MKVSCLTVLAMLFSSFALTATEFKNTELLYSNDFDSPESLRDWTATSVNNFRAGEGEKQGGALYFHSDGKTTDWIKLPLDSQKFTGLIRLEARVKGLNIQPGDRSFYGAKVMLHYTVGKKEFWPEPYRPRGSFDWKTIEMIKQISEKTSSMELILGLQAASGDFWVDSVKIWKCTETETPSLPPSNYINEEAAQIPRGNGSGSNYRGFMSGKDLSPEAFKQLRQWNVNLMRYQMRPDASSEEKYLAWIDKEIPRLDSVLKLAQEHNIKLVIDLHRGIGTKINKVSSNLLASGTNTECMEAAWKKLAAHYKDNPGIYGYDLLNEPEAGETNGNKRWREIAERLLTAIRSVDKNTPVIVEPISLSDFTGFTPLPDKNVIYSPHFYQPFSYTHQGVHEALIPWSYPGYIDGAYWDKEQLRVMMKSTIEFQRKYNVPIYVGEFSVVNWAQGGDRYIADMIDLMEEYGWDWTYHAFREWNAWSIEHEGNRKREVSSSLDNPRKTVLLQALSKNATK